MASAVLVIVGMALRDAWLGTTPHLLSVAAAALAVAAATFAMASRLTGMIASLQRSTEAIANGDFERAVDLECACEIGGLAQSFRKMSARMNANIQRINTLAYTDPITALPNRAFVDHLLHYALAPERGGAFRAAIVFIDLDGFKRINDTLGHDGGDELLRQAARRILAQAFDHTPETIDSCMDPLGNPCDRLPEDLVFARFAGDEFVAILPGRTDRAALSETGARVIASLREPFRIKGLDATVGASVGIAIAPEDTASADELLTFADLAMYQSKQAGKARFMFFDKSMRQGIVEAAAIEADLRRALTRRELVLHFQPKVDTASGTLHGVEALLRWQHPTRGLVFPGAFIGVAEQSGLMAQLGQQVLELAVAQCRAWLDAGTERAVAVNVSPSQFGDAQFADKVLAAVREAGVPPRLLSIEITESMAMTDFDTTAQRLAVLREAGIQVAIDDFGIGFSNLSQLSRLPMDELKIDRSLIVEIGRSSRSESIIRAIVGMAHALGYRTIAEGIETREQLRFLAGLGCDTVQGYLFGRPMPPDALEAWCRRDAEPVLAV